MPPKAIHRPRAQSKRRCELLLQGPNFQSLYDPCNSILEHTSVPDTEFKVHLYHHNAIRRRYTIKHRAQCYVMLCCVVLCYVMLCYTIPYYTILYYTILYYTILYYTILYYTILYYTILYYTILYYTILYYTILYYTILYYTILYYTILYYTILYYTILYYTILYYTVLYDIIFHYVILHYITLYYCNLIFHCWINRNILRLRTAGLISASTRPSPPCAFGAEAAHDSARRQYIRHGAVFPQPSLHL